MTDSIDTLKRIYDCFNARDIEGVLTVLADDVAWANGMEGGHVHGRAAVRAYWTRQWAVVSPHVEPVRFDQAADGRVTVQVRQTVRDLAGQAHAEAQGLKDKLVGHVFRFRAGRVIRFDIQDAADDPAHA